MLYFCSPDSLRILKNRHNNREDFTVVSQADLLETVNQITATMTLVLLGIASISLLVGGIGIMNIMLVSVRERTREIGVRKAIGASRRDIIWQFLIEAMALTVTGGLMGVLAGMGISTVVRHALPSLPAFVPAWAILLGVSVAASVGLFFGIYPAVKAAKLDPVEALRYE